MSLSKFNFVTPSSSYARGLSLEKGDNKTRGSKNNQVDSLDSPVLVEKKEVLGNLLSSSDKADSKDTGTKIKFISQPGVSLATMRRRGGRRGRNSRHTDPMVPPEIDQVIRTRFRAYYGNTTAITAKACTANMIMCAMGGMCSVVNSTFTSWGGGFRIRSITIYPATVTSGVAQASIADVWWATAFSGFSKDVEKVRPIPNGTSVTGACVFKPPKNSLASFWIAANALGSNNVFVITAPEGSVVLFDAEFSLAAADVNFSQVTQTITTGVVGTAYYLALDGAASNLLRPLALSTTS